MDDSALTDAYYRFSEAHGCFLDRILCDPELRKPFLIALHDEKGGFQEAEALGRLVYLRKRGLLARKKPR